MASVLGTGARTGPCTMLILVAITLYVRCDAFLTNNNIPIRCSSFSSSFLFRHSAPLPNRTRRASEGSLCSYSSSDEVVEQVDTAGASAGAEIKAGDSTKNICSSNQNQNGDDDCYNICGPPKFIRRLKISDSSSTNGDGNDETVIRIQRPYFDPSFQDLSKPQQHTYKVSRLAYDSDVFLLKNFLTPFECEAIVHEAKYNYNNEEPEEGEKDGDVKQKNREDKKKDKKSKGGMTVAVTNDENKQSRSNCSVAWMGDARIFGLCKMIGEAVTETFVTDGAQKSLNSKRSDMQVLHYGNGGQFVLHHDGFDRILTVICYLNGVGETWLPLVGIEQKQKQGQCQNDGLGRVGFDSLDEAVREVEENNMRPGRNGVLLSGSETMPQISIDTYYSDQHQQPELLKNNPHKVFVKPGDAVAFYSYANNENSGQKDYRSIHAGLPVEHAGDEGKWLATCWFHAPSLVSK